jgi:hypothetical protein
LEAGARLSRFPDKKKPGEFITHTVREDLFGVFDLAVFPVAGPRPRVQFVQVTSLTGDSMSAVRSRQAKVANWIRLNLSSRPVWLGDISLVAWVSRKHLRIWEWDWTQQDAHRQGGWREQPSHPAKLPKVSRSAALPLGSSSDGRHPFA